MTYDRRKGSERQQLVVAMRRTGMSFGEIGRKLGITWGGANALYQRAGYGDELAVPPPPAKVWCEQCQYNMPVAGVDRCTKAFCKAKAVAA